MKKKISGNCMGTAENLNSLQYKANSQKSLSPLKMLTGLLNKIRCDENGADTMKFCKWNND